MGDRKDWYDTHIEAEKARSNKIKRKARDKVERFVYEYLSYTTCKDCGEFEFSVLTFDHVRGKKKMEISVMAAQGYSIDAIRAEITNCIVLCFNCHMRKENEERSGFGRGRNTAACQPKARCACSGAGSRPTNRFSLFDHRTL